MSETPRSVREVDWESWTPRERAVLCFVVDRGRILLIDKKTGLGSGMVNGPGGRIEPGETDEEAAVRETREETGILASRLRRAASLSFVFTDGYSLHCAAFVASAWEGIAGATREAAPFWCDLEKIPYHRMWQDDVLWLPRALAGEQVTGRFVFEAETMLSHEIEWGNGGASRSADAERRLGPA